MKIFLVVLLFITAYSNTALAAKAKTKARATATKTQIPKRCEKLLSDDVLARELVRRGFDRSVAERLKTYAPDLAREILSHSKFEVVKVYRGLPILPSDYDPTNSTNRYQGTYVEVGEDGYASGFATGAEGASHRWTSARDEITELRKEFRYMSVLLEMQVPSFFIKEKSTAVIGDEHLINDALFLTRLGTIDLKRSFNDIDDGSAFVWIPYRQIARRLKLKFDLKASRLRPARTSEDEWYSR